MLDQDVNFCLVTCRIQGFGSSATCNILLLKRPLQSSQWKMEELVMFFAFSMPYILYNKNRVLVVASYVVCACSPWFTSPMSTLYIR